MCPALRSVSWQGRKMLKWLRLLLPLLAFPHYGRSQTLHQTPHFISLPPGSSVQLNCSLQGYTSNPFMYWYQQPPQGGALHMLFLSRGKDMIDDSSEKHFKATRPTQQEFTLSTRSLFPNDTGLYYCAWSRTGGREQYFGDGTKLTVLEDGLNITSPKVVIFPPSKQEIKEKGKATLVCLASDFYPDHIKLFWKVNDAEREDGVRTDDFSRWDKVSKSYSLTSRLRISVQEWFNSKNSFQCAVKFHLDKIQYQVIRGEAGCSITEESYMRYGNSTKLTYLVLLWKAMLYALLVSALVWRVKAGDKLSRE